MSNRNARASARLFCRLGIAACALLPGVTTLSTANACSIDGIASVSIDGRLAERTAGVPSATTLRQWAPFTFARAYAPGVPLHLAEDRARLRRALSPLLLKTPFRWDFGDGQTAHGLRVTHRYHRAGWYTVVVYAYWPPQRLWTSFDSVRLHIVPAGTVRR